jgi:dynein heavy chain
MYKKRGKKHPPIILNPLYSLEKVEYSLDNVDAHVAPSATSPRIHGKYSNMLTVPPISTDKKAADVTLVKKQPELKEKTVQINYRKALEPKVMCPFETKEGVTPRKIEIERLKRQFATQNLQQILLQKLAALELPHSPKNLLELLNDNDHANGISAEGMLPLHLFDNSLFDCRTVDDWLDMSMIPDEQVGDRVLLKAELRHPEYPNLRQAIVPLPAKAFDSVEWRDCIAVCYDESREMWKVKWRSYNGYNLEKIAKNAGNVYVHPEDIDIDAQNKKCDPRVAIEGTEMWVYRIHVMFLAESVQHFADRVCEAVWSRHETYAKLVFCFYLETCILCRLHAVESFAINPA